MAVLRDLTIRIRPDADVAGFRRVDTAIDGVGDSAKVAAVKVVALGTAFGNIAAQALNRGLVLVRKTIAGLTTGFAQSVDELAKFSKATGQSIASLQEFRFAAGQSGIATATLDQGLLLVAKRARDASIGLKAPQKAFDELGVAVKDASGNLKSQDVLLLEIADRFKALPQGTQKSALAMEIFGRSGAKLIPLLNEGSVGINRMRIEARQLGGVLSDDTAKKAEDFNDSMARLRLVVRAVQASLASQLLPIITRVATRFTDFIKTGDNLEKFLARAQTGVKAFAAALGVLAAIKLGQTVASLVALGPAIIAIGAIGLAIQQIIKLLRGEDNLISKALGDEKTIADLRSSFAGVVKALQDAAKAILPALAQVATALLPIIADVGLLLADTLQQVAPLIASLVTQVAPVIAQVLGLVTSLLKDIQPLMDVFIKDLGEVIKELMPVLRDLFAALIPIIQLMIKQMMPLLRLLLKAFGAAIIASLRQFASILKVVGPIIGLIGAALSDLGEAGEAAFNKLINAAKQLEPVLKPVADALKSAFNQIETAVNEAKEAIEDLIKRAKNLPGVRQILSGIKVVGGVVKSIRSQPRRSTVSSGVTASEIAQTTTRGGGIGAGGGGTVTQNVNVGGVSVNVSGGTVDSPATARKIAGMVNTELNKRTRRAMEDVRPSSR